MQCEIMLGLVGKMKNKIRTYSELITLPTFEERYKYLKLSGVIGEETFGFDRYLNQQFYTSELWKSVRNKVIIRDNGCDLGVEGHEIQKQILIHHMNPITIGDIRSMSKFLLNPEYLISTTHETHNAIHYGDESLIIQSMIERKPNDTCPWRQ